MLLRKIELDKAWHDAWAAGAPGAGAAVPAPGASAWACVTAAFDPAAPAAPAERSSSEVQAALAALAATRAELGTWFLEACRSEHARFLARTLAPLAGAPASAAQHVPGVVDALFAWVCERQRLLAPVEQGGLALAHEASALAFQCKTQLVTALAPRMLDALVHYFTGTLRVARSGELLLDAHGVQVAAQLRMLGLDALVQGVATRNATAVLRDVAQHVAGTEQERALQHTLPALETLLHTQLLPALETLLEAVPEGHALPDVGLPPPAREVWDVSHSLTHEEAAPGARERDALRLRLEYSLAKVLGELRCEQLFDLVGVYPESRAALEDLRACLDKTDEKTLVAEQFARALRARLLHPGVDTHAVLVYYVHTVYALRLIDTTGVVLSQVLPGVQRYLRTRADTIQVVVAALLGDDPAFALLRTELESEPAGPDAPRRAPRVRGDDAAEEEAQYARLEYWADPHWTPRPVDAGPEYSQLRSRDVIDLLVSIFDDYDGFVRALEQHTAQQLVRIEHYDRSRVQRNNAIFKRRFGESSLHHCDVMLRDIGASELLDTRFHEARAAAAPDEAVGALHPILLSRQFWPEMDTRTFTMPVRLARALEQFAQHYAATQTMKRVRWLPHVGTVQLEVEMADGRRIEARVSPLQAAVAELVAGLGVPPIGGEARSGGAEGRGADPLGDGRAADADGRGAGPEGRAAERLHAMAEQPSAHPKPRIVTADNVAAALDLDRNAAVEALRFWAAQGVLEELPGPSGSFAVQERV